MATEKRARTMYGVPIRQYEAEQCAKNVAVSAAAHVLSGRRPAGEWDGSKSITLPASTPLPAQEVARLTEIGRNMRKSGPLSDSTLDKGVDEA